MRCFFPNLLAESARRICSPMCSPKLLAESARRICSPKLPAEAACRICLPNLLAESARQLCLPNLPAEPARHICSSESARRICSPNQRRRICSSHLPSSLSCEPFLHSGTSLTRGASRHGSHDTSCTTCCTPCFPKTEKIKNIPLQRCLFYFFPSVCFFIFFYKGRPKPAPGVWGHTTIVFVSARDQLRAHVSRRPTTMLGR